MFLKRRVARIISDLGNWTAYDARALPGSNSPIRRSVEHGFRGHRAESKWRWVIWGSGIAGAVWLVEAWR